MSIGDGQFRKHAPEIVGLINEPFAAGVIYPAVLAAWFFVASVAPDDLTWEIGAAQRSAILVFVVGFAVALFFNLWLKLEDRVRMKISRVIPYLTTKLHA